jgi:hypothetical protein
VTKKKMQSIQVKMVQRLLKWNKIFIEYTFLNNQTQTI